MLSRFNLQSAPLVRVRNNQRRSRARRREYIGELEEKLHTCEANGVPIRNIVPQETLFRLKEENRKLRELLDLVGIENTVTEDTLVDTHLDHDGGAPTKESSSCVQNSSETGLDSLVSLEDRVWLSRRLHASAQTLLIF